MKLKYRSAYYSTSLAIFIIVYFFFLFSLLIKFSVILFLIVVLSFFKFVYDITLLGRIRKNWNKKSGYIVDSCYFTSRKIYLKYYGLRVLVDCKLFDVYSSFDLDNKSIIGFLFFRNMNGIYNNKAYKYVVSELSHIEDIGDGKFRLRSFPVDVYEHNGKYFFDIESIDLSKESTI